MDTRARTIRKLEILQGAIPALRRSRRPLARWDSLRDALLAVVEELESPLGDDPWPRAEAKLDAIAAYHGLTQLVARANERRLPGAESPLRGPDEYKPRTPEARAFYVLLGNMRRLLKNEPPAREPPRPIEAHPEVIAPKEAAIGETFEVRVAILGHPPHAGAIRKAFSRIADGPAQVAIRLVLPDGVLIARCHPESIAVLPENGSSAPVVFAIEARATGLFTISISFCQNDFEVLRMRHDVRVQASARSVEMGPPQFMRGTMRLASDPQNGLVLRVERQEVSNGGAVLDISLVGDQTLLPKPAAGTLRIARDAHTQLIQLTDQLRIELQEGAPSSRSRELRLRGIADSLGNQFLPSEVQHALISLPEKTAIHVECEAPWVPWELLLVGGSNGFFMGERFAVSRWLRQGSPRLEIPSDSAVMAMSSSARSQANSERRALEAIVGAPPVELSRLIEVQELLASRTARVALLYFACHGGTEPNAYDKGQMWLDEGALKPTDAFELSDETRSGPVLGACVLANACSAARPGYGLFGHGGFAQRFIQAGAAAFVAPAWVVDETLARPFAAAFYDALQRGLTLGEAAHEARNKVREEGGADWLAYTVYASPSARIAERSGGP